MSVPLMVGVAAGTLLLGLPVLVASNAVVAGARAANAADAGALAAADALLGRAAAVDVGPCELAAEVAVLHGAAVARCELDEAALDARVRVTVQLGVISVSREARAGPPNLNAVNSRRRGASA